MCVIYQRFVCCWSIIYPGDSVAKFTWRNSAYLSGSKCKLIIVSVYLFCFFGRVSSTLSSFALTILHCYTDCHVEPMTPPSEVCCQSVCIRTHFVCYQGTWFVSHTFGGGGRICTAVHNNFLTTSTNIFLLQQVLQKLPMQLHTHRCKKQSSSF